MTPGETLMTAVQLKVDPEWHVYWVNPGDAGMPTSATLDMPKGFTSAGLKHPVPGKFLTGGLHGFGHGGTVNYPLSIEVPKDFDGNGVLKSAVSWLTCNNEACIPGDVTLELLIKNGEIQEANVAEDAVIHAFKALPAEVPDKVSLEAVDAGKHWKLSIAGVGLGFELGEAKVFIETPELVAPSADLKFVKTGEIWVAECPKSEFAPEKPEKMALLLVPSDGARAVRLAAKLPQ